MNNTLKKDNNLNIFLNSSWFNINSTYKIIIGLILLGFSLLLPKIIWFHQFNLLENLYNSISFEDSGLLFIATAKLVLLNTARHLPIYAGAFIISEGIYEKYKINQFVFMLPLITIPIFYYLISYIYNIDFVFAGPSYLTIFVIFIIHKRTEDIKAIPIKVLIISFFLFAIDWLDIVPILSKYGFGRGEVTISIKQATEFMGAENVMNFLGLTFSLIILLNAIILSQVVVGYYHRLKLIKESQEKERRLKKLEMEAIKSRYLKELKHLVHDLKTPLVTIQGLSGVIDIKSKDGKINKYANKIINASEEMSLLISEILNKNKMYKITLEKLFDFIKVQLSMENYGKRLRFSVEKNICVYVNKFRLSRAIVNLIDNALKASNKGDIVSIKGYKKDEQVKIIVKDKGKGIPKENLDDIWKIGFTTDIENTGLGLNFVKQVIDNHEGKINIKSECGQGTEMEIILPGVEAIDEEDTSC